MSSPPPLPLAPVTRGRRKGLRLALIIGGGLLLLMLAGYSFVQSVIKAGFTEGPDNMFGDQHLKTAVALIELHKVRYGGYPQSLRDLRFTGRWDELAIQSVKYHSNPEHTAYYIEVQRGWIGKPHLEMSEEFWQGTGYSPALKPDAE